MGVTIEECKEICKNCKSREFFLNEMNKYGVGRCLKDLCDNSTIEPLAEEFAKKLSENDPNSANEWD